MKKSILHLPNYAQKDLLFLIGEINKRLPQAEMIILYGGYATGKYIGYNEHEESGLPVSFITDYDILVVTSGISDKKASNILDNINDLYCKYPDYQTPVQFINDDIKTLNRQLEEGRYFYTQLKKEGIVLYDSGKFKTARMRKLNFKEIQQEAQKYFDEKFHKAELFLDHAIFDYKKQEYIMTSFDLNQATENLYYSIRLTFTLKNNKQHNLTKLSASVKRHSEELINIFPYDTIEDKRLFLLLKDAYVESRYNPDFLVTKDDIDALLPQVKRLRDITKRICEQRISEYGEME